MEEFRQGVHAARARVDGGQRDGQGTAYQEVAGRVRCGEVAQASFPPRQCCGADEVTQPGSKLLRR